MKYNYFDGLFFYHNEFVKSSRVKLSYIFISETKPEIADDIDDKPSKLLEIIVFFLF